MKRQIAKFLVIAGLSAVGIFTPSVAFAAEDIYTVSYDEFSQDREVSGKSTDILNNGSETGDTSEHTHMYSEEITKAPTCTEAGEKILTCSCGDVKTETIPMKEHNYVNYRCKDCGILNPNHTHSYSITVSKKATCTETGIRKLTCSCGDVKSESIKPLGHCYRDGECCRCQTSEELADWSYSLIGYPNVIWLNKYKNDTKTDVIVRNSYKINGKIYPVSLGYGTSMFMDRKNIETITFCDGIDTSNMTGAGVNGLGMFWDCSSLKSIDFGNSFDTSNLKTMYCMFNGCSSLTSLDLSSFDTSNVTNMDCMFDGCSSLTSLDLSSFDTSNVTSMAYMFANCSSLKNIDVSSFNTENLSDMRSLFETCSSLTALDLRSFDTSNVTRVSYVFSFCDKLSRVDVTKCKWTLDDSDLDFNFDHNIVQYH
jgi:surface protein